MIRAAVAWVADVRFALRQRVLHPDRLAARIADPLSTGDRVVARAAVADAAAAGGAGADA